MKKLTRMTTAVLILMFFVVGNITAQKHSKADMSRHKMLQNMPMNCDSTMMKKHMKDCKMDCGEKMGNHKGMMKNGKMMCDSTMMKDHKGMMKNESKMMGNNMIHKGVIDVNSIDANKDGKVYQDMMDWNVISDKPGKCPNCGMKLKEVSIDKAKKNLQEYGFKVK